MLPEIKQKLIQLYRRYLPKPYLDLLFVTIGILIGIDFNWSIDNIAGLAFIIWAILNPWSSSRYAKVALYFLCLVPVLLIMGKEDYAEKFAIYTYYFLILAVVMALVELRREKDGRSGAAPSD
ncbi:MAG: hypothetical protein AAB360_00070 [Patescibacteria group bacterium]